MPGVINLKIKRLKDEKESICQVKRNTQLKRLMNYYCEFLDVDFDSTGFFFDGKRLSGEETPEELKMEDASKIYFVEGKHYKLVISIQKENEKIQHLPPDQAIAPARFESLQIELDELKAKLLDLPTMFNYSILTEEMSSIRNLLQSQSSGDKKSHEPSRFMTPKPSVVGAVEILLVMARLGYLTPAAIEDPLVASLIGDRIHEVKAMIASVASSESN